MDDSKTEYELIDRLYYSEEKISISISQIFKDFDKSSLHMKKKYFWNTFTNSHNNSSSNISQSNSKNKKKKRIYSSSQCKFKCWIEFAKGLMLIKNSQFKIFTNTIETTLQSLINNKYDIDV